MCIIRPVKLLFHALQEKNACGGQGYRKLIWCGLRNFESAICADSAVGFVVRSKNLNECMYVLDVHGSDLEHELEGFSQIIAPNLSASV